jgi:hypothetical protein
VHDILFKCRFVVKTTDDTGRKVFVNMCSNSAVPVPAAWPAGKLPEEVSTAISNLNSGKEISDQDAEALRLPLSLGEPRNDLDKHSNACTVFDCVFSTEVMKSCGMRAMKVFVTEAALAWIDHKHKLGLDKRFKLPKLKYKGESVQPHRIRKDRQSLIQEIEQETVDEDPIIPLRAAPIPAAKRASPCQPLPD